MEGVEDGHALSKSSGWLIEQQRTVKGSSVNQNDKNITKTKTKETNDNDNGTGGTYCRRLCHWCRLMDRRRNVWGRDAVGVVAV